mmetsp:Transcript_26533/g.61734  ORF Transcript_26533/g.61734 Transcript_26533/m.61734 type:complete len:107 (+) Transcript_26533:558-878(+)
MEGPQNPSLESEGAGHLVPPYKQGSGGILKRTYMEACLPPQQEVPKIKGRQFLTRPDSIHRSGRHQMKVMMMKSLRIRSMPLRPMSQQPCRTPKPSELQRCGTLVR